MIDIALRFLKDQVESHLARSLGVSTITTRLSPVVDDTGKFVIGDGAIGLTLINVEEDRTLKGQLLEYQERNGQHVAIEPGLHMNLVVMFAAHFKHYDEALKCLSCVLEFFQGNPGFSPETSPGLDPRIRHLNPELLTLTFEQLNQVWAFVGAKQLPSVFYRVRTVSIRGDLPVRVQPPVTALGATLKGT